MTARDLHGIIGRYNFNYSHEVALQEGIARVLTIEQMEFAREVALTQRDRIDFMVGRLGIEVKVGHPLAQVMRQLHRYAQLEQVDELLLVTNRCRHAMVPEQINGKPVEVLFLGWGLLR
jgi:hypothetical protein